MGESIVGNIGMTGSADHGVGRSSVHAVSTGCRSIGSPQDDVGVVLVLERGLLAAAAAVVVAGLLLEEAAPASASAVSGGGRLLGLAAAAAVGPRAARGHRAGRRARLPAAVARAARHRQLTVAEDM